MRKVHEDMKVKWYISYNDIVQRAQQGTWQLTVDDAAVWSVPMEEFGLNCHVSQALCAELSLMPLLGHMGEMGESTHNGTTGILVRGTLKGSVVQACDLCAEDAPAQIAHSFEVFEALPSLPSFSGRAARDDEAHEDLEFFFSEHEENHSHFVYEGAVAYLDLPALCWEEFLMALPSRPLCSAECKGLCVHCGANLNMETCACAQEAGDPRFAVLRSLKIQS